MTQKPMTKNAYDALHTYNRNRVNRRCHPLNHCTSSTQSNIDVLNPSDIK